MNASAFQYIHDSSKRNPFFGEVKHRLTSSGDREVELVVMPDAQFGFELSMAALAIDGSRSMLTDPFSAHLPPVIAKNRNTLHPIAQDLAKHLAKNAQGQCALAYWACGDDGSEIEPVGILSKDDLEGYYFGGPQNWGGTTKLTPIVRYFWEQVFVSTDKLGYAIIITDGAWEESDHQELLHLTQEMCEQIASGQRYLMKTVLVGLKTKNNANEIERIEARFNSLDDFESGTDVDVWNHKWLDEITNWSELFIEEAKDMPFVGGYITDAAGNRVLESDEFNFGIRFKIPGNSQNFTLHLEGVGEYPQPLA